MDLLDEMICAGRLSEFIDMLINKREEEKDWEYYLHKVFDKSFNDFKNDISAETQGTITRPTFDVEATLQDSMNLAMNFNPEENERGER